MRVKFSNCPSLQLRGKANELWDTIVRLETEKYDLEERQKRQDYDVSIIPAKYGLFSLNLKLSIMKREMFSIS